MQEVPSHNHCSVTKPDTCPRRRKRRTAWIVGGVLVLLAIVLATYAAPSVRIARRGPAAELIQSTDQRSRAQVLELYGKPDRILTGSRLQPGEVWLYRCKDGIVILEFHHGIVIFASSARAD